MELNHAYLNQNSCVRVEVVALDSNEDLAWPPNGTQNLLLDLVSGIGEFYSYDENCDGSPQTTLALNLYQKKGYFYFKPTGGASVEISVEDISGSNQLTGDSLAMNLQTHSPIQIRVAGSPKAYTSESEFLFLELQDSNGVPAAWTGSPVTSLNISAVTSGGNGRVGDTSNPPSATHTFYGFAANPDVHRTGFYYFNDLAGTYSIDLQDVTSPSPPYVDDSVDYFIEVIAPGAPEYFIADGDDPQTGVCRVMHVIPYWLDADNDHRAVRTSFSAEQNVTLSATGASVTFFINSPDCGSSTNPITSFFFAAGLYSRDIYFKTSDPSSTIFTIELSNGSGVDGDREYEVQP